MVQQRAARFVLHSYSILSRVIPMINQIGPDTLEQRRLLSQLTKFYKIQQGPMGIPLPPEIFILIRASSLPNSTPYRCIQCNCNSLLIFFLFKVSCSLELTILYHCRASLFLNQQFCSPLDIWCNSILSMFSCFH